MGCGSSHSSVVAVAHTEKTSNLNHRTSSLDHFVVNNISNSDGTDIKNIKKSNQIKTASMGSINSLRDNNNNKVNSSIQSVQNNAGREKSAFSVKSSDSGVFDEGDRLSSAKSQKSTTSDIATTKPPSAGKKTARQKLLRFESNELDIDESLSDNGMNMISRPRTRLGNVAFDLVLEMPGTGNVKKRPDQLAELQFKKRRTSKKIKTKEEIDRKLEAASSRRKIQETDKQLKAKQFQHLSINTTVQPFKSEDAEEKDNSSDFIVTPDTTIDNITDIQ